MGLLDSFLPLNPLPSSWIAISSPRRFLRHQADFQASINAPHQARLRAQRVPGGCGQPAKNIGHWLTEEPPTELRNVNAIRVKAFS